MRKFNNSISAELIKLKYPPILWLCVLIPVIVAAIIFAATYMDTNALAQLGKNPWVRHQTSGLGIFGVFLITPFIVMLVSTAVFIENQSHGWKQVYSSPHYRSSVFFAKLFVIIGICIMTMILSIILNLLCAYALDFMIPEIEFRHYEMRMSLFLPSYIHVLLSTLGIIGIQYFLSLRFKGFLIPMSFGIIAFIVGFIIGTVNKPIALYSPYSYPSIVRDYHMFTIDEIGIIQYGFTNTVELYSIIIFIVFIIMANILEVRKNIG